MVENLRSRLIDGCSRIIDNNRNIKIDKGYIIENLLLFNQYILQSIRLKELPTLVELFGIDGLNYLFSSGALKIFCEALTIGQIGQIGQTSTLKTRRQKGILPLGSYSFATVEAFDKNQYMNSRLSVVDDITFLDKKEKERLKSIVFNNLTRYPDKTGKKIIDQLKTDIASNDPSIKIAISYLIRKIKGIEITPNKFNLRTIQLNDNDFKIETDFKRLGLIDIIEFHKIVERALLTIGGRNQRIYNMKTFNALTSFREIDSLLFSSKLDFLAQNFQPTGQRMNLKRILRIKGIPTLGEDFEGKIDVDKLIKMRHSEEFLEFRSWLWNINELSDIDLDNHINSYKQKLGEFFRTPFAKTIRLITSIGLGLIPSAGIPFSVAYGILDLFLLEKVLPVKGPIVFLNRKLPTIFR